MPSLLGLLAAAATFVLANFAGMLVLALIASRGQAARFVILQQPFKLVLQVALWGACGWLALLAYGATV